MDQNEKSKNSIKVVARFKPSTAPIDFSGYADKIKIYDTSVDIDNKTFNFEGIANTETSQEIFFDTYIKDHILKVEDGINSSVLCYGFTGSGKTYTLFGRDGDDSGIVYRSIHSIFELMKEKSTAEVNYSLNVSMVEIYMEKIYDLIDSKNLFIGVSGTSGLIGATKLNISSEQELINIITAASVHRKTQDTRLNSFSSRSHCIIIIQLKKYLHNGTEKSGNLYLVDLAGCERISNFSTSLSAEEDNIKRIIKNTSLVDRLKFANTLGSEINKTLVDESKNINKSIFELNNVVTACSSGQKYIPYRNSKITMVLKDALGGNSNTLITICCSDNVNETLMTLRFGARCKKIKNTIKNNIVEKDTRDILIIKLQSEIHDLKELLEISKKNIEAAAVELRNKLPTASSSRYPYSTFSVDQDTKRSIDNDDPEYSDNMCDKLVNKIFGDLIKDPVGLDINQSIQITDSSPDYQSESDQINNSLDDNSSSFDSDEKHSYSCLKKTIKLSKYKSNIVESTIPEDTPCTTQDEVLSDDSTPVVTNNNEAIIPVVTDNNEAVPSEAAVPVVVYNSNLQKVENVEFCCCTRVKSTTDSFKEEVFEVIEKVSDVVIEVLDDAVDILADILIPGAVRCIQQVTNVIPPVLDSLPLPESIKDIVKDTVSATQLVAESSIPIVDSIKKITDSFTSSPEKAGSEVIEPEKAGSEVIDNGSFSEEVGASDTESNQNSIRSHPESPPVDPTPLESTLPKTKPVGKSFCC